MSLQSLAPQTKKTTNKLVLSLSEFVSLSKKTNVYWNIRQCDIIVLCHNFFVFNCAKKDNKAFKSDVRAGRRAATVEQEKTGSIQWCTQTRSSLAGHVEPGSLVNREWKTLGVKMAKRNLCAHHWIHRQKYHQQISIQSFRFSIMHMWHPHREVIKLFKKTACSLHVSLWQCTYLLGISLQFLKKFLNQWGESPMENFQRPCSNSLLVFHFSMVPLSSVGGIIQIMLFESNMKWCFSPQVISQNALLSWPWLYRDIIMAFKVRCPANGKHNHHLLPFYIAINPFNDQVFLCIFRDLYSLLSWLAVS